MYLVNHVARSTRRCLYPLYILLALLIIGLTGCTSADRLTDTLYIGKVHASEIWVTDNTSLHTEDGSPIVSLPASANETDPIFTASPSAGIGSANITNWNNKLSSFTESDPVWVASASYGISAANITTWSNKVSTEGEGRLTIQLGHTASVVQGTWLYSLTSSQITNGRWRNSTNANGDSCTYNVYLAAGTYTVFLTASKDTNCAKVDIQIDGSVVATFDLYGNTTFNVVFSDTGNAVATSGIKTITVIANGYTAPSTAYAMNLSILEFVRTS